jgi:hypothetical protein
VLERNELLCNNKSRQIIKQVEDNKTSLLSFRDTGSQCTRASNVTDNRSLLDRKFEFDQELITTSARAALGSNIRRANNTHKRKTAFVSPLSNRFVDGTFLSTIPETAEDDSEGISSSQLEDRTPDNVFLSHLEK